MFFTNEGKPTQLTTTGTTIGVGAAAGFGIKMLLDSGSKSKTTAGFINILNGFTFNLFTRNSEKVGSTENNLTSYLIGVMAASGFYYWLASNSSLPCRKSSDATSSSNISNGQGPQITVTAGGDAAGGNMNKHTHHHYHEGNTGPKH